MNLPIIRLAAEENWDCQACGVCCRGSLIPLSADDLRKIREQQWELDREYQSQTLFTPLGGGRLRLAHRADGSCIFLTADNRCRIHEKFGAEVKPVVCRTFPLQLIPQEKHATLTLRRACPSAAKDEGRPLAEHLAEVERLVAEGSLTVEAPNAPPINASRSPAADAWKNANRVLVAVARIFGDERYPPVRRVVHAILLARLLDKVKLPKLSAKQFAEVIELLESSVADDAKPFFADRRPPGAAARLLFRRTAVEFARLHPAYRPPTGFFARASLARTMWRTVRGRGRTPDLPQAFPALDFAALEEPLTDLFPNVIARDLQQPLERYLATSAASYQYALANRGRWSLVQSVRALALTFPLALYLLRWTAAGREPTRDDVAYIISALDRGQGYASLTGAGYRWTLDLLEMQGELERLAVWYAR